MIRSNLIGLCVLLISVLFISYPTNANLNVGQFGKMIDGQFQVPLTCECPNQMQYLNFTAVQPFHGMDSYVLEWAKNFSKVYVKVEGQGHPIIVGTHHPYQPLTSNTKYFNMTGLKDIYSLNHLTCGESSSTVTFSFIDHSEEKFLLLIFGIDQKTQLKIRSMDAYGSDVYMNNWQTIDYGILSPKGMNMATVQFEQQMPSANISSLSTVPYVILKPDYAISNIKLELSNHCQPPKCTYSNIFYALIAIGDCESSSTTTSSSSTTSQTTSASSSSSSTTGMTTRPSTTTTSLSTAGPTSSSTTSTPTTGSQSTTTTTPSTTTKPTTGSSSSPATTGQSTTGQSTTRPSTTAPATTAPATTAPATTGQSTTGQSTTRPSTTAPATTAPATTAPATTAPATTGQATTGQSTTRPSTTAPATTAPATTAPATTAPATTGQSTTGQSTTRPSTTAPATTALVTTAPATTAPATTGQSTTGQSTTRPSTTAPATTASATTAPATTGQSTTGQSTTRPSTTAPATTALVTTAPATTAPATTGQSTTGQSTTRPSTTAPATTASATTAPATTGQSTTGQSTTRPSTTAPATTAPATTAPATTAPATTGQATTAPATTGQATTAPATTAPATTAPATTTPATTGQSTTGQSTTRPSTTAPATTGQGTTAPATTAPATTAPATTGQATTAPATTAPATTAPATTAPATTAPATTAPATTGQATTAPATTAPATTAPATTAPATTGQATTAPATTAPATTGQATTAPATTAPATTAPATTGQATTAPATTAPATTAPATTAPATTGQATTAPATTAPATTAPATTAPATTAPATTGQATTAPATTAPATTAPATTGQATTAPATTAPATTGQATTAPATTAPATTAPATTAPATTAPATTGQATTAPATTAPATTAPATTAPATTAPATTAPATTAPATTAPATTAPATTAPATTGQATTAPATTAPATTAPATTAPATTGQATTAPATTAPATTGQSTTGQSTTRPSTTTPSTIGPVSTTTSTPTTTTTPSTTAPSTTTGGTCGFQTYTWADNEGGNNFHRIGGVRGTLYRQSDPNKTILTQWNTTENGITSIFGAPKDKYCIHYDLPQGYKYLSKTDDDNLIDSNGNYCFELSDSNCNPSIPAGFIEVATNNQAPLTFYTWLDSSRLGRKDANSPPVPGLNFVLTGSNGNVISSWTSDNFNKTIDNLYFGQYCIMVTDPNGKYIPTYLSANNIIGSDGKRCFTHNSTEVLGVGVMNGYGFTTYVIENLNGTLQAVPGAEGILYLESEGPSAIKKNWVISSNGTLLVDGLPKGRYCIQYSKPTGFDYAKQTGQYNQFDTNGKYCFNLNETNLSPNIFAEMIKATDSSSTSKSEFVPTPTDTSIPVTFYTWHDRLRNGLRGDNPYLPGLVAEITQEDIPDKVIARWTTTADLKIVNLEPGDYCIKIWDPKNTYIPNTNNFNNTYRACFTVTPDDNLFGTGFVRGYGITTRVWSDDDKDGNIDSNESPLANITGTLYLASDPSKVLTSWNSSTGTTIIDQVPAGSYCIKYSVPEGYSYPTTVQDDNKFNSNGTYCFTLNSTLVTANAAAGLYKGTPNHNPDEMFDPPTTADSIPISVFAWYDSRRNGIKASNSQYLTNLTGEIYPKGSLVPIGRWKTANGLKQLNVPPGEYCIKMTDPSDQLIPTMKSADSIIDQYGQGCFTVSKGATNSFGAGFLKGLGVITAVWSDENENGSIENNEFAIVGVLGSIYLESDGPQAPITQWYTGNNPTTTVIDELDEGRYCIAYQKPNGYIFPTKVQNDNKFNGTGVSCFNLTRDIPTVVQFAGLYKANESDFEPHPTGPNTVQISMTWYSDGYRNKTSLMDPSAYLSFAKNVLYPKGSDVPIARWNSTGPKFMTLEHGEYCVQITPPIGDIPINFDDEPLVLNKSSYGCFNTRDHQSFTATFLHGYGLISSVWGDSHYDGVVDKYEVFLNDVQTRIYANLDNGTLSFIRQFNTSGSTILNGLSMGNYCIQYLLPPNFKYPNLTGPPYTNDLNSTGYYCFSLNDTNLTEDIYAGLYPTSDTASAALALFLDPERNGIDNSNDPLISGLNVQLYKNDSTELLRNLTSGNGLLIIDKLDPGSYCIKVVDPSLTLLPSIAPQPTNMNIINKDMGGCFTVGDKEAINIGAGFKRLFGVKTLLWNDSNADGQYQMFEKPIADKMGDLYLNSSSSPIAHFITKNDFVVVDNLTTGTYCIQYSPVPGYNFASVTQFDNSLDSTGKACFSLNMTNQTVVIMGGLVKAQ